ncbi:MAG: VWA domain-containing protein [Bryobacteraceae bacterium]
MVSFRIALFALVAACLAAQPPAGEVFRARTGLVVVPVTVTGAKSAFADGLEAADFRLLDNGRSQPVEVETADALSSPISIVVLVQTNDLARPALAKIQKIGSMIQPLITGERGRAAVAGFGSKVDLLSEFTDDAGQIGDAFARLKESRDSTARMRDAVDAAVGMLAGRPARDRKAILIIGETRDRGSEIALADVVQAVQRSGITVYAATFSVYKTAFTAKNHEQAQAGGMNLLAAFRELGRLGSLNDVEALTEGTGGERASFATLRSLEARISRLGEELHAQYQLTYRTPPEPGYHRIVVSVEGRPELKVRARPGYWVEEP